MDEIEIQDGADFETIVLMVIVMVSFLLLYLVIGIWLNALCLRRIVNISGICILPSPMNRAILKPFRYLWLNLPSVWVSLPQILFYFGISVTYISLSILKVACIRNNFPSKDYNYVTCVCHMKFVISSQFVFTFNSESLMTG